MRHRGASRTWRRVSIPRTRSFIRLASAFKAIWRMVWRDHDPSGLDMTRSLREELSLYVRAPIKVVRLGLNLAQVRDLRLPPNPAKETDTRHAQYVRDPECTDSWELDALSPAFIDGLIERAVSELVDHEAWGEALDRERANKTLLNRTATSFAETGSGL
jgi:hypothetical protein